jgi:hypothetical protein
VVLLKDLKSGGSSGCRRCATRRVPFYLTKEDKKLARSINQWKVRCCSKAAPNYKYYGGRGIRFDFNSIQEAVQWVKDNIGPRPAHKQIDRIDNERHYEPGNLRWATKSEQMFNRRHWEWSDAARIRYKKLRAEASLRRKQKAGS